MDWITHDEDVWFDFRGNSPDQLTAGRYYRGTVDGFADFGVFVDLSRGVTGLLHRSELDRRLESLDWEEGDTVFVQVKNVRDNGNIDLGWSIRQSESEFRGARIHDPDGDADGDPIEVDDARTKPIRTKPTSRRTDRTSTPNADAADGESTVGDGASGTLEEVGESETSEEVGESETSEEVSESKNGVHADDGGAATSETDATDETPDGSPDPDRERVPVDSLGDRVGDTVRLEGVVVGIRQTSGPTVFELRDETGVVECAAFVEAGVRAYPAVEIDDAVRLDGEVERRHNELQVETESLVVLEGDDGAAVEARLADAMSARARPDEVTPLADHEPVSALSEQLAAAAETIRRAVFESRPIVVRHAASADGYVAGAAIERAVLPLIREEYAAADAEYHYFTRRPLDDPMYGMDAATNDVTRMLQDRDRHDEKLPLVLLVGTGSTTESTDGLGLLGVYDAGRVVIDAAVADEEVVDVTDVLVDPGRADVDATDLSTGALAATLAAAVNPAVREDLGHLPAVSYWEATPEGYVAAATEAGYDAGRVDEIREAVALEAYYQSYEDKRELITDLLFDDAGGLAGHVSEQFRVKLGDELETAEANLESRGVDGVEFAILRTDEFTHRFDFPPTTLLLDELHRRNRTEGPFVTVGVGMDELYVRSTQPVDVRAVAEHARERVPEAGITALGVRQGRIEFLSGMREAVLDAVVDVVAEQV